MRVDVKQLLREQNIPHTTAGKNIGTGNIGVVCPTCGDRRNHCSFLGISGVYKCFSCDTKGFISTFLIRSLKISYHEASQIISAHSSEYYVPGMPRNERLPAVEVPGSKDIPLLHKQYLTSRGFDPEQLCRDFDIRFEYQTGRYKYRVIIPVYFNNIIQTFVARDVTEQAELRYKNCPISQSIIPTGELIYGWDTVSDTAIICEGIFDAWKVGDGAVAVLGTSMTPTQIRLLSTLKKAYLLFDAGKKALAKAEHLHSILCMCGVRSEILTLPAGVKDPGDLTKAQVHRLRALL